MAIFILAAFLHFYFNLSKGDWFYRYIRIHGRTQNQTSRFQSLQRRL